jgi:hypothetical protein
MITFNCFLDILLEQIERIESIRDTNDAGGINYRKLSALARQLQIIGIKGYALPLINRRLQKGSLQYSP